MAVLPHIRLEFIREEGEDEAADESRVISLVCRSTMGFRNLLRADTDITTRAGVIGLWH